MQTRGLERRLPPSYLAGCLVPFLHPAARGLPPRSWALRQQQTTIAEGLAQGRARRLRLMGEHPLDALMVAADAPSLGDPACPIMVVTVGFAMTYESVAQVATALAISLKCRILLYNSRGVGNSGGRQRTPQEPINDCRVAIGWAVARARWVGVYGISMGAALTLLALQAMAHSGALRHKAVGLWVGARGFASVSRVVAGHLGAGAGRLAAWLLQRADVPLFDLVAALALPVPAEQVMLTSAAADWVIPRAAQTGPALSLPPNGTGPLPSGQLATFAVGHGQGHLDRAISTPLHDAVLERWRRGPSGDAS